MITNLFSVFDPSTRINNLSMNWLSTLIGIILIQSRFWLIPSRQIIIWNKLTIKLHQEFKTLLNNKNINKGRTFMLISLILIIIFNNTLGLFPYIFTRTRHITITLSLALPLWTRFIIFGWINNIQHIFAHLVPQGTPPLLIPFIVCIETVRNIIRPGTLAVRLAANIIAGHLLLTLLGNTGPYLSNLLLIILITTQILLLILESAVAIIQSYVFAVLRTLYSREVN